MKMSKSESPKEKSVPIVVAFIGLAGVLITALLGSSLIEKLILSTPVPSSTPTMYLMETSATTLVAVTGEMQTVLPAFTLTPELENTITASSSPEPMTDKMVASLQASMLEGKAPLKVNFDARISSVQFADGSSVACGTTRLCAYTFTIQLESKWLDTIRNNEGVFSYTFGRKGQYLVAVYVCRGDTCDSDEVEFNIR